MPSVFDPELLRAGFPLLGQMLYGRWPLVYLDNGASTPRHQTVLEAMDQFERTAYANVHRGNHWLSETASAAYEDARQELGRFLGAGEEHEIIFTSGTTAAINLVAHGLGDRLLRPGDEILLTLADHHSNIVPWQQFAARRQLKIVWYDHAIETGIDAAAWSRQLTERTRLAAWPAVSNVLGWRAPNAELARLARERGVISLIDAAQHVAHEPTDITAWNADFVAFSGHKMFGPTGIGALAGRRELLESMEPFLGGGSMIETVTREGFTPGRLPARFEAGTPPIVQAVGLAAAARFLTAAGLEAIAGHIARLTVLMLERIAGIPGLRVLGPPAGSRTGIVSLSVEGVNPQDLAKKLDLRGIATRAGHHCTMPLHEHFGMRSSLRASLALFNRAAEVEHFAHSLTAAIGRLRG
jgi:cysteine desulfurase/selenocysteine lyase